MRLRFQNQLAALATAVIAGFAYSYQTQAATFGEQEIDPSNVIAVAAPVGEELYNLLVIEQIPGQRQCWSESGSKPITVEPLLLNFDFSQSCRRSTDSNGYSIRIEGQDYGLEYLLRVVKRNGELQLVGTPVANSEQSEVVIGRTHGLGDSFLKIFLDPGWKVTKRTYEDKTLGHVYFSGSSVAVAPSQDDRAEADPADRPDLAFSAPRSPASASSPLFKSSTSASAPTAQPEGTPVTVPAPADTLPPLPSAASNATAASDNAFSSNRPLPPPPAPRPLPSFLQTPEPDSVPIPVSAPDLAASTPPAPPAPSSRRSLSEIIAVTPRIPNGNGQTPASSKPPVPEPPASSNAEASSPPLVNTAAAQKYKVVVEASPDQDQIRSLYPEAFSTTYNGQSVMQIGVFSSRDNADQALQKLKENGLSGILIPI